VRDASRRMKQLHMISFSVDLAYCSLATGFINDDGSLASLSAAGLTYFFAERCDLCFSDSCREWSPPHEWCRGLAASERRLSG
jgi:hypothetical protein